MPLVFTDYDKHGNFLEKQISQISYLMGMDVRVIDGADEEMSADTVEFLLNALKSYEARQVAPVDDIKEAFRDLRKVPQQPKAETAQRITAVKRLYIVKNFAAFPEVYRKAILFYAGNTFFMKEGEHLNDKFATPAVTLFEKNVELVKGNRILVAQVGDQPFAHGMQVPLPTNAGETPRPIQSVEAKKHEQLRGWEYFKQHASLEGTQWGAFEALVPFVQNQLHPEVVPTEELLMRLADYAKTYLVEHLNNNQSRKEREADFKKVLEELARCMNEFPQLVSSTQKVLKKKLKVIIPTPVSAISVGDMDLLKEKYKEKYLNPTTTLAKLNKKIFIGPELVQAMKDLVWLAVAEGAYGVAAKLLHGRQDDDAMEVRNVLLRESIEHYVDSFHNVSDAPIKQMLRHVRSLLKENVDSHLLQEKLDTPPSAILAIIMKLINMPDDQQIDANAALREELFNFFKGIRDDGRPLDLKAVMEGHYVPRRKGEPVPVEYKSDELQFNMAYNSAPYLRYAVTKLLPAKDSGKNTDWDMSHWIEDEFKKENLPSNVEVDDEELAQIYQFMLSQIDLITLIMHSTRFDTSDATEKWKAQFLREKKTNVLDVYNPVLRITNARRLMEVLRSPQRRAAIALNAMVEEKLEIILEILVLASDEMKDGSRSERGQRLAEDFAKKYADRPKILAYLHKDTKRPKSLMPLPPQNLS